MDPQSLRHLHALRDFVRNLVEQAERSGGCECHRPPSLLLVGPPGAGKTYLVKQMSNVCEMPLFGVHTHQLTGPLSLRNLFSQARELDYPSLFFLDDIDYIFSDQDANPSHDDLTDALRTELYKQLGPRKLKVFDSSSKRNPVQYTLPATPSPKSDSGYDEDSHPDNNGIILVAATSSPWILYKDHELLSRFRGVYLVGLPDRETRFHMLKFLLQKVQHNLTEKDFWIVADKTEGYTPSDLMIITKSLNYKQFSFLFSMAGLGEYGEDGSSEEGSSMSSSEMSESDTDSNFDSGDVTYSPAAASASASAAAACTIASSFKNINSSIRTRSSSLPQSNEEEGTSFRKAAPSMAVTESKEKAKIDVNSTLETLRKDWSCEDDEQRTTRDSGDETLAENISQGTFLSSDWENIDGIDRRACIDEPDHVFKEHVITNENSEDSKRSYKEDNKAPSEDCDTNCNSGSKELTGQSEEVELSEQSEEVELSGQSEEVELSGQSEEVELSEQSEEVELSGQSEEVKLSGHSEEVELNGQSEEVDVEREEVSVTVDTIESGNHKDDSESKANGEVETNGIDELKKEVTTDKPLPKEGEPLPPKEGEPLPPKEGEPLPLKEGEPLPPKEGEPLPLKEGEPLPPKEGKLSSNNSDDETKEFELRVYNPPDPFPDDNQAIDSGSDSDNENNNNNNNNNGNDASVFPKRSRRVNFRNVTAMLPLSVDINEPDNIGSSSSNDNGYEYESNNTVGDLLDEALLDKDSFHGSSSSSNILKRLLAGGAVDPQDDENIDRSSSKNNSSKNESPIKQANYSSPVEYHNIYADNEDHTSHQSDQEERNGLVRFSKGKSKSPDSQSFRRSPPLRHRSLSEGSCQSSTAVSPALTDASPQLTPTGSVNSNNNLGSENSSDSGSGRRIRLASDSADNGDNKDVGSNSSLYGKSETPTITSCGSSSATCNVSGDTLECRSDSEERLRNLDGEENAKNHHNRTRRSTSDEDDEEATTNSEDQGDEEGDALRAILNLNNLGEVSIKIITLNDVLSVVSRTPRSVTDEEIKRYTDFMVWFASVAKSACPHSTKSAVSDSASSVDESVDGSLWNASTTTVKKRKGPLKKLGRFLLKALMFILD